MSDIPKIIITAKLDQAVSLNNIIANLKDIEKQIKGITVKYNVDDSTAKKAFSELQKQQNDVIKQSEQMQAAISKSMSNSNKVDRTSELNQAKAINKAIDEEYAANEKLAQQVLKLDSEQALAEQKKQKRLDKLL